MRTLFLLTLAGLIIGLMGDVVAGGVDLSFGNVFVAFLLAPILSVSGARVLGDFLIAGVLFWPVWGLLAWRWTRHRNPAVGVLIVAWSTLGFFKLISRMEILMSV